MTHHAETFALKTRLALAYAAAVVRTREALAAEVREKLARVLDALEGA